ncbi:MAG: hypothetical protein IH586_16800, partial [Anaerolineaceae bacterium]|nr:hypothetical protein [Anaerolineaceae bacterium]
MENSPLRFYPGTGNPLPLPLARFLPPIPTGIASAWLKDNTPPGGWLLDPLGTSPALILEAARAGYCVLVACNNPILSFMIETLATAPSAPEFQSVLAELAMAKRGDERLEKHILSLYITVCENCGEHIPAQAFLWRKGEPVPYARIYHCSKCSDSPSGERPLTTFDLDRLNAMGGDRLQRARALQRVMMKEEDHRADIEEALENYLPRPLYVLFTLINKIEGMGLPPERVRLLHALLLSTFDNGNTLWPWPGGRARPRQLSVPPQFRENNLWLALEDAASEWTQPGASAKPVHVTHWPDLPSPESAQNGAICLFRGRVKALTPLPADLRPQAVLAAFPRPSQAFWTLSVLWAGWLWGPEAVLPMRSVLDRRRYDWNWHTSAIHSALAAVGWSLPEDTPFFGILPELAPGFLGAVLVASQAAGFTLDGLALRTDDELVLARWHPSGASPPASKSSESTDFPNPSVLEEAVRAAIRRELEERGEPAPYLVEYAAGLRALLKAGLVQRSLSSIPSDLLTRSQAILARTFSDRSFLKLYGGPSEEAGWWWLQAPGKMPLTPPQNAANPPASLNGDPLPLADQIEIEIVRYLQKNPLLSTVELDEALCTRFPELLTPPRDLLLACLESYAEAVPDQPGKWRLSSSETAQARRADLQEISTALAHIAEKLEFRLVEKDNALAWETVS